MSPVEIARSLIGVPWKHQGRDPAVGIDCAGLLILAFGVQGETPSYGRMPYDGLLEKTLASYLKPLPDDAEMRPGDAVAMAYTGTIRHCGILGDYVYGGLSLIHTDSTLGRVTEHPLDAKWLRRVRKVYRSNP